MQLDRFTTKSQEALQAAVALAASRRNTEVQPEHLLATLLEQRESLVPRVLETVGASPEEIRRVVNAALDGLPTITAGAREPANARELLDVLRAAEREAGRDARRVHLRRAPAARARRRRRARPAARSPATTRWRRRSPRSAARTASPPRIPRAPSRRWRSSAATSPPRPRRASSTP